MLQKSVHTPLHLSSNDRIEAVSWKSSLSTGRTHIQKDGLGRGGEAFLLQKDGLARGSWHLAIKKCNQMCIFYYVVIKSYVYYCELQIHHDKLYQMDPICMQTR